MIFPIIIIFIAFAGFVLATYLFHKKRSKKEPLICPFKGNCTDVIRSDYSTFFHIPVEILGLLYYACIAIGYGMVLAVPESFLWLDIPLLLASTAAALFSLYLTFIQFVTLRKICTWCLCSAAFCLAIFSLSFASSINVVLPFLIEYKSFIIILHVLSMALGLGAATLADVFFFRFLKDTRISHEESRVLTLTSEFIWFALCMVVTTGLALYLPETQAYHDAPKFMMKMIVVGIIIVNGAFLNLYIAPKLVKISFGEKHEHKEGELLFARKIAFALGPISIISWYSAFILGSLPASNPIEFFTFFKVYAALLIVGITVGQIMEQRISRKSALNA